MAILVFSHCFFYTDEQKKCDEIFGIIGNNKVFSLLQQCRILVLVSIVISQYLIVHEEINTVR